MQDLLFNREGNMSFIGDASKTHQEDILIMHKGWNKFYPHNGVGILDYISDDSSAESLKSSITHEFERDGMQVKEMMLDSTGKVIIDASY